MTTSTVYKLHGASKLNVRECIGVRARVYVDAWEKGGGSIIQLTE